MPAMLIVFASKSAVIATNTTPLGNLALNAAVIPRSVTMPIRAHIICTAAMSGQVIKAVLRREPGPNEHHAATNTWFF